MQEMYLLTEPSSYDSNDGLFGRRLKIYCRNSALSFANHNEKGRRIRYGAKFVHDPTAASKWASLPSFRIQLTDRL